MTIEEAIKHAEEVADMCEFEASKYDMTDAYESHVACQEGECAEEHRQLAEWLKELKDYKERIPSYEAGYNDAKREIALSGEYERAYERGKSDARQTRWIPVSERLPEDDKDVLVQMTDYSMMVDFRTASSSGWFWAEKDDLPIAWMPLPEPYKAESEVKEYADTANQEKMV